jgi:ESX secretion-associated protein EspD/H
MAPTVGHNPPNDPGDHDDLAALGFFVADAESAASDLDALDDYGNVAETGDEAGHLDGIESYDDGDGQELPVPLFSVTNPPGTVTVTTFLDGRVQHVDLSPKVTAMAETHLAEEIVVIAELATQDARSAQYSLMLQGMREQGHDDVATGDFLTRDLDLPTPQEAQARRAEVFATRYAGGHE